MQISGHDAPIAEATAVEADHLVVRPAVRGIGDGEEQRRAEGEDHRLRDREHRQWMMMRAGTLLVIGESRLERGPQRSIIKIEGQRDQCGVHVC